MPTLILGAIALCSFVAVYAVDYVKTGGGPTQATNPVSQYLHFDPPFITDALSGLAAMSAAVLGIVITVVSLLVQLSSERYTGVAQMFLRDRVNVGVMAYFVVACVCGVFVSLSVHSDFVPRVAVVVMIIATVAGLLVMLPYFAYVFRFLEPSQLVDRIAQTAARDLAAAVADADPREQAAAQGPAVRAMEELTDITSNSISGKDKIIASRAVDAIKDFVLQYLAAKRQAHATWHELGEALRSNPDFVAMDAESLRELETDQTWFEYKAMRQLLAIYAEAQNQMPDINYLVAIDTRYIGEAALAANDRPVVELTFRFMNSFLRSALNARAVRTAYNVLNQYRMLVEAMVRAGCFDLALEGVRYMIYYGRTGYDLQLGFVTETVAYDVSALCEFAHGLRSDAGDASIDDKMLTMFLELDQPLRTKRNDSALAGIRKAQMKLACYYLHAGAEPRAQRIARDMREEDAQKLTAVRHALEEVVSKEFWEIIDRGRNFEYMPPHQKAQLERFMQLVDAARAQVRQSKPTLPPVSGDGTALP